MTFAFLPADIVTQILNFGAPAPVDVQIRGFNLAGDNAFAQKLLDRGQVQTMWTSFVGLFSRLAFAVLLVYLLIVVNFQSWTDAFIIITALPAALAGIEWMLFLTHTPLSVPALTGAIMSVGEWSGRT